jgi:hypothetical protein
LAPPGVSNKDIQGSNPLSPTIKLWKKKKKKKKKTFAHRHEHKLPSQSGINALGLPDNVLAGGSVVRRFYYLEASPKGSSLEMFATLL